MYPNFDLEYGELADGRVRVSCRQHANSTPSLAFMHGNVGALAGAPASLGLPMAEVEVEELTASSLVVVVRLPESRTLAARARRTSMPVLRKAALSLMGMVAEGSRHRSDNLSSLEGSLDERRDLSARVAQSERALGLTARQTEVLGLIARGKSNKEIAAALDCAENTVEFHVSQLLRKAHVQSRAELIARLWDGPGPAG